MSPVSSAAENADVPLGQEEGEEKVAEEVLPELSASANSTNEGGGTGLKPTSPHAGSHAQDTGSSALQDPSATNASTTTMKLLDGGVVRLTRENLTALPHAVADGFWYTRDRVAEGSVAVVHQSQELATSVRTWKCWTVSAAMTCSFYMCLAFTIPALILLVTLLLVRKYNKDGGETLHHNITNLRHY